MYSNFFSPRKSCCSWDNVENCQTSQPDHRWQYNTAHSLCMWITKSTDTRSEYVILIAFPQQQWLYVVLTRLSIALYCTCIACFVCGVSSPSLMRPSIVFPNFQCRDLRHLVLLWQQSLRAHTVSFLKSNGFLSNRLRSHKYFCWD